MQEKVSQEEETKKDRKDVVSYLRPDLPVNGMYVNVRKHVSLR